jgi:hypothetical protein
MTSPTGTVALSGKRMGPNVPDAGASTSTVTLSVMISRIVSPSVTSSPSRFNQRSMLPSSIVKPSLGMNTSVATVISLEALMLSLHLLFH